MRKQPRFRRISAKSTKKARGLALVVLHKFEAILGLRAEQFPAEGKVVDSLQAEPDGLRAGRVGSLAVNVTAELRDEIHDHVQWRHMLGAGLPGGRPSKRLSTPQVQKPTRN